ncbi:hypothetical protein MLD38_008943 [Melastoma candidum]|uniref:Uncharacterized protein n=1 Tax=Melastoma candidum TaxID=119954 RepID=A0ACB9RXD4_9MYRT|nr:hypothetical protein MLD38_008943 [Melastoma candidum]
MAPEVISSFLQALPFNHPCLPKLPRRMPLPLIICRSGQSEPHGSGPASPTPGQVFLERQDSVRTAKLLIKEFNKDRKKGRAIKDKASKVTPSAGPSCYGCGAPLQTSESDAPGYVDRDTFELVRCCELFMLILRPGLCGVF